MDPTTGVMTPAAGVAPVGTQPPAAPAQPTPPAAGPPAGTPPDGTQPPAGQPAAPPPDQQVQVPVTVLQAVRQENQTVKAQLEQLQQQIAIYRANMGAFQQHPQAMAPQPPPAAAAPADPFTGMRDDDVLTVADVKKIVERLPSNAAPSPEIAEVRAMAMKLEVAQADPQYEHTIRSFLPEVLAADPTLRQAIVASPNPLKTALSLARTNPRFLAARQQAAGAPVPGQPPQSPLDQLALILQNLEKPGNPGQFGAAPSGAGSAGRFATMNDQEFEAHVRAVKGGI